jgi:membrane protein DedA with SNARE-associated domain
MNTVNILKQLVENYQVLVYFFIFIGLIIEGEFILISVGILLHLGALSFPLALFFIFLGVLCKPMLGYYFGVIIHDKWHQTKFLKYIEKRVLNILPHFRQRPSWSIFVSKFILGVNNIVIIFSGYQKIDFKRYLRAEFFSTIIWVPTLLFLGYLFSYAAFHISHEIWRFSLIVLVLIVLFIILDKLVGWLYGLFEEFYNGNGE